MNLSEIRKVLLFVAHHDDETIGAGATIKKLTTAGVKVQVVFATDGSTGVDHTKDFENKIVSTRISESKKVAKILGIKRTHNWGEKCQELKYSSRLLHEAIKIIRRERPDLIITHTLEEKHSDHQELSKIVTQAAWKSSEDILPDLGPPFRVNHVWGFEVVDVLSKVDFTVDVSRHFQYKIAAMNVYESQHNVVSGINRFMEGLAKVRGFDIGKKFGESFVNISIQTPEVL